jgi:hypothetical protein
MMRSFLSGFVPIVALLCLTRAWADEDWARRVSEKDAVLGCWQMLAAFSAPQYSTDPWPEKVQFYYFADNLQMLAFRSSRPKAISCASLKRMFSELSAKGTWKFEKQLLVFSYPGLSHKDKWGVNLVTRNKSLARPNETALDLKEGDLLISLDDRNVRVPYRQWLRRIP